MKIALFTDSFYPEVNGVATSCLNLEQELTRRGHEVHIYAPRCKGWRDYQRANLHYIPSAPCILLTDRNVAIMGYAAITEAIAMKYDIIHTHSEFIMGPLGCYVAKATGCARVHTYHTAWENYTHYVTHGVADRTAKKIIQKYSEWWCQRFDRVIAPSEKTRQQLLQYQVEAPISVIPSGMDLDRFAKESHTLEEIEKARLECGVQPGERVLLNIGRISKEKHIEKIMAVFPQLHARRPDVRFVIIGEGPERERLQKMAQELGVAPWVSIVGAKPWEVIDRYYAIADVFVSASRSETQGLTYIEAMAAGLCVCAVNDPCLDNVIINGENGILTEDSEEALLEGLVAAFSPAGKILAANAPEATRRFTAEQFAVDVEACYQAAIRSYRSLTV